MTPGATTTFATAELARVLAEPRASQSGSEEQKDKESEDEDTIRAFLEVTPAYPNWASSVSAVAAIGQAADQAPSRDSEVDERCEELRRLNTELLVAAAALQTRV